MTDQIDIANDQAELILSHEIAAALDRAHATRFSMHCLECDEPLPPHRQQYGTCVPCQTRIERLAAMGRHAC